MQVVLACGDVPETATQAANDWIAQIIVDKEERRPAASAEEVATLHRRSAPRQGSPKGVRYKESKAKVARRTAAAKDRLMKRERANRDRGRPTMSEDAWSRLWWDAEELEMPAE